MNPATPYAYLQGLSANVDTERHPLLDEEVVIGRGTTCQIQLADPKVSRKHARIRFREGEAIIEDLKSSHGTLVNGQRILSAELKAGDELTLGDTRWRFEPTPDAVQTMMVGELGAEEAHTPAMIACRTCGEKVAAEKRFCPQCGQALHEPVPRPSPAVQPAPQAPVAMAPMPPPVAAPAAPVMITGAPEGKERRRWAPFLLGVAIPLLLAILVVAALVLFGVFDEPEAFPDSDQQVEAPAQALSDDEIVDELDLPVSPTIEGDGGVQPSANSPFGFRAYNPEVDQDLPAQANIAEYLAASEGPAYDYLIQLSPGEDLVLDYFYCGKTESLLSEIAGSIQITFKIEEAIYTQDSLHQEMLLRDTRACNVFRAVLYDIAPGEYLLTQTMSVSEPIYDGWETWGPEEMPMGTLIRMEGELPPIGGDNDGAVELIPAGEFKVTLHEGDARTFTVPPAVIAYANTQQRPAPAEIAIEEGCGNDCWRFNEWLGITKANQWLEGYSTVPTTALGVQFWGDDNDGQARVYLDGDEIWSGDTRGDDNQWPGGAFVRYLEVSGLREMSHSIIVEALESNRPITLYFFGIGAVTP